MIFKFLIIIVTLIKLTACDIKYNDLPVAKGGNVVFYLFKQ